MTTLHHIALGARDVEGVACFYRDIFGLGERARHVYDDGQLRSIWLGLGGADSGGAILMIEHTEEPVRRVEGIGAGPFLLAFSVETDAERAALEERLSELGVEIEDRTDYTSYFRDPEQNRVAVSSFPL